MSYFVAVKMLTNNSLGLMTTAPQRFSMFGQHQRKRKVAKLMGWRGGISQSGRVNMVLVVESNCVERLE